MSHLEGSSSVPSSNRALLKILYLATLTDVAFVSQKFGMVINDRKTVVMRYDPTSTKQTPITIGNMQLQYVVAFNYLGSKISPGNDMTAELQRRIGQARSTFSH